MNDTGKIMAGLIIFLGLITLPIWYHAVSGNVSKPPDLEIITKEKQCVAPAEYMKVFHMDMLNQWRDEVVRKENRVYKAVNGKQFIMSLSNTCLDCHSNKDKFCDRCHDYLGVKPYCFDCHIEPKEVK